MSVARRVHRSREAERALSLPLSLPVIYVISIVVLGVLSWVYVLHFWRKPILFSVGFGLIFGGAISNLYFRIADGFVYDYFHLELFGLRGAWNLADIGIIVGIGVWLLANKLKTKSTKQQLKFKNRKY